MLELAWIGAFGGAFLGGAIAGVPGAVAGLFLGGLLMIGIIALTLYCSYKREGVHRKYNQKDKED